MGEAIIAVFILFLVLRELVCTNLLILSHVRQENDIPVWDINFEQEALLRLGNSLLYDSGYAVRSRSFIRSGRHTKCNGRTLPYVSLQYTAEKMGETANRTATRPIPVKLLLNSFTGLFPGFATAPHQLFLG